MSTLSPKKQEIADRESRILELARRMVLGGGYHGLGLDGLATELGVSRGTRAFDALLSYANDAWKARLHWFRD